MKRERRSHKGRNGEEIYRSSLAWSESLQSRAKIAQAEQTSTDQIRKDRTSIKRNYEAAREEILAKDKAVVDK